MCGIAGLIALDQARSVDSNVLVDMANSIAHRGPDGSGVHVEGRVGLSHRRLSIIDIEGGRQPMSNDDGSIWISYNGEVYNYRGISQELRAKGHRFRTSSDTEVVLRAYEEWGVEAVTRFNGMFAIAIWDARQQALVLARDRLGIKPLYWTIIDGQIAFASEVKAFSRVPGFRTEANLDAISSYLTFRQSVWDICFYANVNKVLPGHALVFTEETPREHAYWMLKPRQAGDMKDVSEADAQDRSRELLEKAVQRRMIADVPIGAYLSGGLDSSITVALMSQLSDRPVNTFSIGYENEAYDEGPWAQKVADHCGANHHHIVLPKTDYLDMWQQLVRQKDAPLSIPHEIPLYLLSREMKRSITVAISGEGADELFGGYGRVQRSPMDWEKVRLIRSIIGNGPANALAGANEDQQSIRSHLSKASHLEHFFHVYNWIPIEEKLSLFSDEAKKELNGDARVVGVFDDIFNGTAAGSSSYDKVLHTFQKIHLGCLLDRLDTMSMAAGIEARVPFVDHELVEYVAALPFRHKMKWNNLLSQARAMFHTSFRASEWLDTNKAMLRRIGDGLLPREISRRKKLGFPTPLDSWLKEGLNATAQDLLLDSTARSRGIFDSKEIESLLSIRQDLPYDFYGKKIWMLMNVEMWLRECIDQ